MSDYLDLKTRVVDNPQASPTAQTGSHRILSLDGGGTIGGYAEINSLIDMYGEKKSGRDVLKNYDEVYATSAGCLVVSGLAANYSLGEIRSMLENEAFLGGIYAPKNKANPKGEANPNPFVAAPNNAGVVDKLKEVQRGFIVAATEVTTGGFYSTQDKTAYLGKVLGHEVGEHPSASAVANLADNSQKGLGDLTFDKIPEKIGLNYQGKPVQLTYVCEDGIDKGVTLITTRTDVSAKEPDSLGKNLGQKVRYVTGDKASFKDATSASPNPRPLFDQPVYIDGRSCYDGGMTGHNSPLVPAISSALERGISKNNISVLSLGVGPRTTSCLNPQALKDPVFFGTKPFSDFLDAEQEKRLVEARSMLPEGQIVRVAPASYDPADKFNYVSSTLQKMCDIDKMKEWWNGYKNGEISNQLMQKGEEASGFSTYQSALNAANNHSGTGIPVTAVAQHIGPTQAAHGNLASLKNAEAAAAPIQKQGTLALLKKKFLGIKLG